MKEICTRILVVLLIFLGTLRGERNQEVHEERKIIVFPFEKVSELPKEPNWYEENVFNQILDFRDQERELQDWCNSIYRQDVDIVNKSGDIIPINICMLESTLGVTFFNNDGNLVIVYDTSNGSMIRVEVLENSIEEDGERYCCIKEEIVNAWDNSYIDYQNNKTLYYYVDTEIPQILKMDEGISQIKGYYIYRSFTTFPVLEKNGEIYTYILEDAESSTVPLDYSYFTKEIKIKKIILTDLEGTCVIKTIRANMQEILIMPDNDSYVFIYLSLSSKEHLEQGEHDIQECFSILKEKEAFIKTQQKEKEYMYLDKYSN